MLNGPTWHNIMERKKDRKKENRITTEKTNIKTKITREVSQISSKSNNFLALIKDWRNGFRLTCAYKKEMTEI